MATLKLVHTWDITNKEKEQFQNAQVGTNLHIKSPLLPALFQGDGCIYMFAFTSEERIPPKYEVEYAIEEDSLQEIAEKMHAASLILSQEIRLIVDPFSATERELTIEELME